MIAEGRESGGLGGLRKKVIFDAQPLKERLILKNLWYR